MEPSHLVVLIIITVAIMGIGAGLSVLVLRGATAARVRGHEQNAEAMIQWRQLANIPKQSISPKEITPHALDMALVGDVGSRSGITRFAPLFSSVIADPVDGTAFAQGETVVHCACGTNYHQHSWHWIGEKNQGKCVSCKKSGGVSTYVC